MWVSCADGNFRYRRNSCFPPSTGELCRRLTGWDRNILVLPTEIAKVYMDEQTGTLNEARIDDIGRGLRKAITTHSPPEGR